MKKLVVLMLFAFFLATLVGCTGGTEKSSTTNMPNNTPVQNGSTEKDNNVVKDEGDVLGQFVGQIDNNSVEIIIDGEPKAFRIEGMNIDFTIFQPKDWVRISYSQNSYGQLQIKSIEKAKK